MTGTGPYEVRLSPDAERSFRHLPEATRRRIRTALLRLADQHTKPGARLGKASKTIRGTADSFHRLRVGDHRILYDVIEEDRVILVLGIVDRRDLDRWLRGR